MKKAKGASTETNDTTVETVEEAWLVFRAACIPANATEAQLNAMQNAFHVGAWASLNELLAHDTAEEVFEHIHRLARDIMLEQITNRFNGEITFRLRDTATGVTHGE